MKIVFQIIIFILYFYSNISNLLAQVKFKNPILKSYSMHAFLEAELGEDGFYNVTQRIQSPSGVAVFRYRASTGKIDKYYKVYNENNEIIISADYDTLANVKLNIINGGVCFGYNHGWNKEYYANGAKLTEQEYRNGIKHGGYKYWDYSGKLKVESYYKDGKLDSVYKSFFQNTTQPELIVWYKNGEKLFDGQNWFENGLRKEYRVSKPKKIDKRWNRDGSYNFILVEDSVLIDWDNGKIVNTTFKDSASGKWLRQSYWENGKVYCKEISNNFYGDNPKIQFKYNQSGKLQSIDTLWDKVKHSEEVTENYSNPDLINAPPIIKKIGMPQPSVGWAKFTEILNQELGELKAEKGTYTLQIKLNDYPNKAKATWIGNLKWAESVTAQKIAKNIENSIWSIATIQGKSVKTCLLLIECEVK